jgi:hypothetical protein
MLLLALIVIANSLPAQVIFTGDWYAHADADFAVLQITKDSTSFNVMDNQLLLTCRNEFHGDTLLLYIKDLDCGRLFYGPPNYNSPKRGSLFAKCYIQKKELKIIYAQKLFRDHARDWGLNMVFYRH